ncbi:hypothetical protein BCEN4_520016 [Burkholderia cenocepacia]|nr:hypothetical protein BCEN4_520016 [Burkholderia cenocepacia]
MTSRLSKLSGTRPPQPDGYRISLAGTARAALPRILSRRTSLRTAERRFGALVCLQSAGAPDENRGYAPAYRPHRRRERRPIRHGRSARILPRRSCSGAAAPAAIHDWTPSSPARM